jgi:hypothetical protein
MELEFKYPVKLLCEIAGISTTAYYRYKNKPSNKDDGIENLIVEIYNKTNKRAGYRMITQILFFAREISSLLQKFFPRHRWGNFMSTPATLAAKSHMFSADSRSLLL